MSLPLSGTEYLLVAYMSEIPRCVAAGQISNKGKVIIYNVSGYRRPGASRHG